ncbi:MAG: ABC transporter permease [Clostridiales bacterium]|nr:ABC transporter permease [Clostridiales bacterium]
MLTVIRSTLKLLFRNKAFWIFLIFAPVATLFILNVNETYSMTEDTADNFEIVEIEADDKVAYYGGAKAYTVKVYDASGSDMSEQLLNDLADTGMYSVCRASTPGITSEELEAHINSDAYNDRMGAVLYLRPDFDEQIACGDTEGALRIFIVSDDARTELLESDVKLILQQLILAGSPENVEDIRSVMPSRQIVNIEAEGARVLSREQNNEKMELGYAFSFMTLGFVFCGAFISHTVIEEQKNMVYTRIRLTGNRDITYLAAKFICTFITSCIITAILAAGIAVFKLAGTELALGNFIFLVFLQGLIFSTLSLILGILAGEIMTSNFAAFTVWCMSSLFAGLYFPLDDSSDVIKAISYAMPQRWFMEGVDMFFVKDNMAVLFIMGVTAAYLMIILSIGNVGIKLKKQEA